MDKYFKVFKIEHISQIDLKEIKRRYKVLALKYHPDHGGTGGQFRFIHDAYTYLTELRKDFDKKESKKFFNKKFLFYGDGSVYDPKKGKWIKWKGNIINKKI
jgi:curved DNA-binding protein CbpA